MKSMLGVKDVKGPIADLLEKLGGPEGEEWLRNFKRFLRKENHFVGFNFSPILADWERYYREIHNLKTDFSGIRIPEANDVFSWLICRPENFFAERAFSGGKKLYPKWKWTEESLDDVLNMLFGRDGKTESYIVRIRANWEADEDFKNLSANDIAERKINTICLTERILLGDFLYWKHQKYLDVKTITLCSSRFTGGSADDSVPFVSWRESYGKMVVLWFDINFAYDHLRSRQEVS